MKRSFVDSRETLLNLEKTSLTQRFLSILPYLSARIPITPWIPLSFQVDVDRFETAAQEEILEEDPNLQEFAACDSYDVSSFEDDGRLKTVESEGEDDDEHHHEPLGMSSGSSDKLQILWDHFIHAEPLSYEVQF